MIARIARIFIIIIIIVIIIIITIIIFTSLIRVRPPMDPGRAKLRRP